MVTLYISEKEALAVRESLEYVLFNANIYGEDAVIIPYLKDKLKAALLNAGVE